MSRPLVAFLTDYGPASEHVGALHAVVAAACPGADRLDLAHDVEPGDVRWGALLLARLTALLPAATVCAVVDPGVGTDAPRPGRGPGRRPRRGRAGQRAARPGLRRAGRRGRGRADLGRPPPGAGRAHVPRPGPLRPRRRPPGRAAAPWGTWAPRSTRPRWLPRSSPRPGSRPAGWTRWPWAGTASATWPCSPVRTTSRAAGLRPGDRAWVLVGDRRQRAMVGRVFADTARGGLLVYVDAHDLVALAVRGGSAAERLRVAPGEAVGVEAEGR